MPICFIDIETTGLNPFEHEVIEVGIVKAENGKILNEVAFSLPFNLAKASPKALEINGWGKREFAPQTNIGGARGTLRDCFEDGSFFCAWHTSFDETFLKKLFLTEHDFEVGKWLVTDVPWSHSKVIDLPSLMMGNMGVVTKGSQYTLLPKVGMNPEFEGKHGALADARHNFNIYMDFFRAGKLREERTDG